MSSLRKDVPVPRRSYGFKRRAFFIAAITTLMTGALVMFAMQSVQRIRTVEQRWIGYNQDAVAAGHLLHEISRQMGYGGFIHNIKNFILRQDRSYLATLNENRKKTEKNLDSLGRFVINAAEKSALAEIRKVLSLYGNSVEVAIDGFRRGLSPVEVDTLVRVDDTPPLNAISTLNQSFMARAIRAEREINMAVKSAGDLAWVLLAVIPVIVLIGVVLIVFLRRIMSANLNLAEVRDELSMLLQQAPDAILHVSSDGLIIRANDRAVALFGYRREELLNMHIETLIPARLRGVHTDIRNQAFEGMSARPVMTGTTLDTLTKSGREIPVEINLNFLLSGGRRIATAIIRDVTERKRAEQALKQAHDELEQRVRERTVDLQQRTRELEQRTAELEDEIGERRRTQTQLVQSAKMATIGEMASGITHELSQPMSVIRMGVEAAQIRIQRGQADIASLSETLVRIESQIVRMSDIVTHMQTFSYQDRSGQKRFNPYQAVREGCQMFAGQLQAVDVELVVDVPQMGDDVGDVLGHAVRLEQVVLNLLSNARDAILSRRGQGRDPDRVDLGRITVRMWEVMGEASVHISIEDNGGGISEDILPHIFEPFATTKDSGLGTGLGLSISHGIVESMGATMRAQNTAGGACFEIVLPRVIEMGLDGGAWGQTAVGQSLNKILIVNTDPGQAHRLGDYLQEMGYLVHTAYNAEEAMRIYESDPVDGVVVDAQAALADGGALLSWLRRRATRLPIFAIVDDVHAGHPSADEALCGATDVWRTSISLSEVAQYLGVACLGHRNGG